MTPATGLYLLLLSGLADPSWPVRESCQQVLALAGPPADPALCWGLWPMGPELRRRVDQLWETRRRQTAWPRLLAELRTAAWEVEQLVTSGRWSASVQQRVTR